MRKLYFSYTKNETGDRVKVDLPGSEKLVMPTLTSLWSRREDEKNVRRKFLPLKTAQAKNAHVQMTEVWATKVDKRWQTAFVTLWRSCGVCQVRLCLTIAELRFCDSWMLLCWMSSTMNFRRKILLSSDEWSEMLRLL